MTSTRPSPAAVPAALPGPPPAGAPSDAATPHVPADRYGPRVAGGGRMNFVAAPVEVRGSTRQVAGLWPFGVGTGAPLVGIPMGQHQQTNAAICADPINWFTAGLLSNPNLFVASQPGLGKSTAIRRMVLGYAHQGITSLILGDLKPDYAELVTALGGQVVVVGPGRHTINPLDAGPWRTAVPHLDAQQAARVRDDVIARRRNIIEALGTLVRRRPLEDFESTVLAATCRVLTARETSVQPTLRDVAQVVEEGPDEVRAVTLARGDDARYRDRTDPLLQTLHALLEGPLGSTFAGQTSVPLDMAAPAVCVDLSPIGVADEILTAASLLVMWAAGFAQVEAAHLLSDVGQAPKRQFFAVMDELWRALRAPGLVDRLDALTRLSRAQGTGLAYISHSLDDLEALEASHDKAKARGIAERCAMKLFGGLSPEQLRRFSEIVQLSEAEQAEVASWAQKDGWSAGSIPAGDPEAVGAAAGVGRFLVKVGARPGLPVFLKPQPAELRLGDTSARFRPARPDALGR